MTTFAQFIAALSQETGLDIEDVGGAAAVEIDGVTIRLHEADGDLLLLLADLGTGGSGVSPLERTGGSGVSPLDLERAKEILEANYLYSGTGGCTLAVNPSDGHLTLQKYTWLDRLSPESAVELLARFAETALHWRQPPAE